MKLKWLITGLASVMLFTAHAQTYPTTVKLSSAMIMLPERYNSDISHMDNLFLCDQLGLYAERMVSGKWGIGAGYAFWNRWKPRNEFQRMVGGSDFTVGAERQILYEEFLAARVNYKMIDMYGFYRHQLGERHWLKAGTGISFTWGENEHRVRDNPPVDFFAEDCVISYSSRYETASYLGIMPQLSYDYMIFNGRYSIGADGRCRKYFGVSGVQFDLGVHIGVNF